MNCQIANKCGGCNYINEGYEYSLKRKSEYMKKLFKDLKVNVHDILGAKDPYGYRNKVIVSYDRNYEPGLYQEHSHKVIPYKRCLLHDEETDYIIKKIGSLFKTYHVSLYDPKRRKGDIRHVMVRRAISTNTTMIIIVSTSNRFLGSKNFTSILTKSFPHIKSIVLNVNRRDTSIVLGEEFKVLYGKDFIVDTLCGLSFKISPNSFYQINHDQCEALYTKALDLLDLKKTDTVLDTYCGIGTIGMIASRKASHVIGVERNKKAVKDARMNASFNKINTIKFIADDASSYMKNIAKQSESVDIVIMDPPRSGSTETFIKACGMLKPREILYISCDPSTQVRDLIRFKKEGYTFTDVYPVDMFPFTKAVESIVKLKKKDE